MGKLFLGRMPWRLFLTIWNYSSFFYMCHIPCLTSQLLSHLPLPWVPWCVPHEHSCSIVCICCRETEKQMHWKKNRPLDFSWLGEWDMEKQTNKQMKMLQSSLSWLKASYPRDPAIWFCGAQSSMHVVLTACCGCVLLCSLWRNTFIQSIDFVFVFISTLVTAVAIQSGGNEMKGTVSRSICKRKTWICF